jgi:putative addiction module killer protein
VEVFPREIVVCQDESGNEAFSEWLDSLDFKTRARVIDRIDRVEEGHFGEFNPIGDSVYELVLDFGPGYRVYFGQIKNEVHLISGGSKRRQQRDIDSAKKFWNQHA